MIEQATPNVPRLGRQHLVRVGVMGHVGRFTSVDAVSYPRHTRVVVRTGRGLELGEVLAPPEASTDEQRADGSILRGLTAADQLLAARLEVNRREAFEACRARLATIDSPAALVDVEHLFDGQTLLFYFMGELTAEVEALTAELAELYESRVQVRRFADAVEQGCGPGCGTDEAAGCKTCVSGCALADACATRARGNH